MVKNKEDKFYKALEEIFLGTEIEGDSGYINLLKIKSNYYKIILQAFKEKIVMNKIVANEEYKLKDYMKDVDDHYKVEIVGN